MTQAAASAPKGRAGAPLDKAAIVDAALTLVDEVGLEGLTTRRLGEALGISGPSLYWHFKSKNALLQAMAVALLARALPGPDLTGVDFDWRNWLAEGARGIRASALSVRDGARILAGSEPSGPEYEAAVTAMAKTLARSGLSEKDSRLTLKCLGRFAISWVLYEQTAQQTADQASEEGFGFGLDVFLRGLEARLRDSDGRL
jgi:TetR/AcrR family tetracycline transcriptional repressor